MLTFCFFQSCWDRMVPIFSLWFIDLQVLMGGPHSSLQAVLVPWPPSPEMAAVTQSALHSKPFLAPWCCSYHWAHSDTQATHIHSQVSLL